MRLFLVCLSMAYWLELSEAKSVILHGGGTFLDSHFEKVIDLAGGAGIARIGIITAASSTPIDSGIWYVDQFRSHGAQDAYWIPVYIGNCDANSDPDVVTEVQTMTGFMFGAGDQARIIQCLYNGDRVESPVLAAIREIYEAGGVVAGTSAGCAAMGSTVMVMGGLSYEALRYGAFEYGSEIGSDDLTYDPDGGIGMLDGYVLDTHFSERGREGRLIRLVSDTSTGPLGVLRGIGADENTALVITDVGTSSAKGEVVGPRGVFIADLTQATVTGGSYWGLQDGFVTYLTDGDIIDLNTYEVTIGFWKSNIVGDEKYLNAIESEDIFVGTRLGGDAEFVRVARSVFDSSRDTYTTGRTAKFNPRFQVEFTQEPTSGGYGGYTPVTENWQISYTDLHIDITYL